MYKYNCLNIIDYKVLEFKKDKDDKTSDLEKKYLEFCRASNIIFIFSFDGSL